MGARDRSGSAQDGATPRHIDEEQRGGRGERREAPGEMKTGEKKKSEREKKEEEMPGEG